MARRKIGLVGAGNIGGELANLAVTRGLGDVVLLDLPKMENKAKGKALDLEQAAALAGIDVRVTGTSSWDDLHGSDILIVTAGFPRKPGQSREDLLGENLPVIRSVAEEASRVCPGAFVIVISNPLDAMVHEFRRRSGLPTNKVVGMAGVLDSLRFAHFAARELGVSVRDVRAVVLGGHGDDMVPVASASSVKGVPLTALMSRDRLDAIIARTRHGGGEIVSLMGTSVKFAGIWHGFFDGKWHGVGLYDRYRCYKSCVNNIATIIGRCGQGGKQARSAPPKLACLLGGRSLRLHAG
jgi:malate dehydrogenase